MIRRNCRLLAISILLSGGCYSNEIQQIRAALKAQDEWNRRTELELEEGWANALCRSEVRQLLSDVKKECDKKGICDSPNVGLAVMKADPTHDGRFITLMSSQRHEVFYFRKSMAVLDDEAQQRLFKLIAPHHLKTTRFLVVSNYANVDDQFESKQRGIVVINTMVNATFTDYPGLIVEASRMLHWNYSFVLRPHENLSAHERPQANLDIPLSRSVWVFRLDC